MGLLLFSTVVDFIHGKLVGHFLELGRKGAAGLFVASSAVINLSLLGFFKYSDFLLGSVNSLFGTAFPLPGIALPIGISFYTFQTMSYTIDVYRGEAKVQDSIVAFGAYVSMFPQLIAGPIVRYHTIARELSDRRESFAQFALGVRYFVIGLGKKVLIANRIGAVWNEISGILPGDRSVVMVWLGIFSFGMQIYFDFSGYSDMAMGLGHMFGFHFMENFNKPYVSKSITEFWRRWHISLGTWFKEYVYIPLGGNRKGFLKQIRNILVVWLLTGIWHGAGWNFLLWGLYFGCLLLLEKWFLAGFLKKLPGVIQWFYTMVLVFMGWVLFAHDQLGAGLLYLREMLGFEGLAFVTDRTVYLLATNFVLIVISVVGAGLGPKIPVIRCLEQKGKSLVLETGFVAAVLILVLAYLVDASYNPFLYFRF